MKFPLGTSVATVHSAPLLLIDLETEDGITGRTYLFCYRPSAPRAIDVVLRDAVSVVKGEPVAPLDIGAKLARRFALVWGGKRGPDGALRARRGVVGCARPRRRSAAGDLPRSKAQADPRLQLERTGPHVAGGRRGRSREVARWRVPLREAATRPSQPRAGPRGHTRGAQAASHAFRTVRALDSRGDRKP
jgi:mandelate racemase/muconate lactonizing enzyme-like protein